MKPFNIRRIGILVATVALVAPALAAAPRYAAVYRADSSPAGVFLAVNQTTFEAGNAITLRFNQGYRVRDIEWYQDASGTPRYDIVFEPGSGAQLVHLDETQAAFNTWQNAYALSGLYVWSLSSIEDASGFFRRYAAVFRPGVASKVSLDVPENQLATLLSAYGVTGYYAFAMDGHTDEYGLRWYDFVFFPATGAATWSLGIGQTAAGFAAKNVTENGAGRQLTTFAHYFDKNNVERYTAVWTSSSTPSQLVLGQSAAQFKADYDAHKAAGWRLYDVNPAFEGAPASWSNYGVGVAGTLGVPDLFMWEDPVLGQFNTIQIGNSLPFPAPTYLLVNASSFALPYKGGTLLVDPNLALVITIPIPVAGGTGAWGIPHVTPPDVSFDGLTLYAQLVQPDPGAPQGFALSKGLQINYGRID